jgi:hypothetical protein
VTECDKVVLFVSMYMAPCLPKKTLLYKRLIRFRSIATLHSMGHDGYKLHREIKPRFKCELLEPTKLGGGGALIAAATVANNSALSL